MRNNFEDVSIPTGQLIHRISWSRLWYFWRTTRFVNCACMAKSDSCRQLMDLKMCTSMAWLFPLASRQSVKKSSKSVSSSAFCFHRSISRFRPQKNARQTESQKGSNFTKMYIHRSLLNFLIAVNQFIETSYGHSLSSIMVHRMPNKSFCKIGSYLLSIKKCSNL